MAYELHWTVKYFESDTLTLLCLITSKSSRCPQYWVGLQRVPFIVWSIRLRNVVLHAAVHNVTSNVNFPITEIIHLTKSCAYISTESIVADRRDFFTSDFEVSWCPSESGAEPKSGSRKWAILFFVSVELMFCICYYFLQAVQQKILSLKWLLFWCGETFTSLKRVLVALHGCLVKGCLWV